MTREDINLDEALRIIAEEMSPLVACETIPISEAHGRIATNDIHAHIAVPRHANSAVDGYGFRYGNLRKNTKKNKTDSENEEIRLKIVGTAAAGHSYTGTLPNGAALRVFTGAKIDNAIVDTIIMEEAARREGDAIFFTEKSVKQGANLRLPGDDVNVGDILVQNSERISAAHIGLLAAQGFSEISVYEQLRVGLLSGGDELSDSQNSCSQNPRAQNSCSQNLLSEGMVFDSNRPMLSALLRRRGYAVEDYGIIEDNEKLLLNRLRTSRCHVVLASGGMSLGQEDHLRSIAYNHGRPAFWRLNCKPGRPVGVALIPQDNGNDIPLIGLPGNPVAAFVMHTLIGQAVLARLSGELYRPPMRFNVRLGEDFSKKIGRREFVRANLKWENNDRLAFRCGKSGAAVLSSVAQAHGLLDLAENSGHLKAGSQASFIPMSELL